MPEESTGLSFLYRLAVAPVRCSILVRKAELLPKFSAHVMRHTACTRMAECRMDVKVLQCIMRHAHIDVTMEVYNHIGELTRIENEIARLDSMVLNA